MNETETVNHPLSWIFMRSAGRAARTHDPQHDELTLTPLQKVERLREQRELAERLRDPCDET